MKAFLIVLILLASNVPGRALADGFFSNYTFIPSLSVGGFLLYGPREEEDSFLEEDGFWGAEQGTFYELGFTAFRNLASQDSISPDIFPFFTSSHGETLDYEELGLRLGVSGMAGGNSGQRGFWSAGVKISELELEASTQTTTDSDVRVSIPGQNRQAYEIYVEMYREIEDGWGWQASVSFKQFFLDGRRRADDSAIDDMEIEIITLRLGLNYMI